MSGVDRETSSSCYTVARRKKAQSQQLFEHWRRDSSTGVRDASLMSGTSLGGASSVSINTNPN
jgi:hypothetical protein